MRDIYGKANLIGQHPSIVRLDYVFFSWNPFLSHSLKLLLKADVIMYVYQMFESEMHYINEKLEG
jgi:hypothetical protein